MSSSIKPTQEEITRYFLNDTLQKLPQSLSQPMLKIPDLLNKIGVATDDTVRILDTRVLRDHLLDTLQAIADGETPELSSHKGLKVSDAVRLNPDGSAEIVKGNKGARFSNVALLGKDKPARQKCLTQLFADGSFEAHREAHWRRVINKRPVTHAEYVALETEIQARAEVDLSEISHDLVEESATIDILARATPAYLLDLVGLTKIPDSLADFQKLWLDKAKQLKGRHLARRLRLAAPIAILGGNLIGEAALGLPAKERWTLFEYLVSSPDPLSVLAALEIACISHTNGKGISKVAIALSLLWSPENRIFKQGMADFYATYVATTAIWAKERTIEDWPLHAQRLAKFVHAAHIARILDQHDVERPDLHDRVLGAFQYRARLSDYRDLQIEPYWQAIYLQPSTLNTYIFRRTVEIVNVIPEELRPPDWTDLGAQTMEYLSQSPTSLWLWAASPFSAFGEAWNGLNELGSENVDNTFEVLNQTDEATWLDRMWKLQVSFELPVSRRDDYRKRVAEIVETISGERFIQAVEINLHIAARWRDAALSDDIINIVFRRFKGDDVDSRSSLARQIILASACEASEEKWLEKLRVITTSFARIYPERQRIDAYRESLMVIASMSEKLAQAVAPALSMASLVDNEVA
ncbi:hypothetical protein [Sphingorhabdus sp.]|uniref:hypothetical protein n=1 Tax=Sphingorhabdus sp. TaxID=1902408 RepID=UPI002FD8892E